MQPEFPSMTDLTHDVRSHIVTPVQLRDINERLLIAGLREQKLAAELQRDLAFTSAITTSLGESVCVLDGNGLVTFANPAASRLLDWPAADLQDKDLHQLVHVDCDDSCPLLGAIRSSDPYRNDDDEFRIRDGSVIPVAYSVAPINSETLLSGVVVAFRDTFDLAVRQRSVEELRAAESRYRSFVEHLPLVTYIEQVDTGLVYTSPQVEQLTGFTAQEWMAERGFWRNRIHLDDRPVFEAQSARTSETGEPICLEHRFITRDRRVVWVRHEAILQRSDDGTPDHWQGFMFDITAQKLAETALRQSEAHLRALFDHSTDLVTVIADDDTITYLSPAIRSMLGHDPKLLLGKPVVSLIHPDERRKVVDAIAVAREHTSPPAPVEFRIRHADGTWRWLEAVGRAVVDEPGLAGIVVNARDVTDRRLLEAEVTFRAFHDPLTGLPNRALFIDRLAHALRRSARQSLTVAVIFLDLDNFKVVNDSLGHSAGDALLIAIATRVSGVIREFDTVARLGGDEFTILIDDVTGIGQVMQIADRVLAALREPVILDERPFMISGSIGIAFDRGQLSAEDVIRDADLAMYTAKSAGKDRLAVFDPAMHMQAVHRLEVGHGLREAIEEGYLSLRYQPEIVLANGEVFGVEALLRWEHPTEGTRLPADFIVVAEETGLIIPLGAWVIGQACSDAATWLSAYELPDAFALSVNISPRQFRDPQMASVVESSLAAAGLHPSRLILEITESILVEEPDHVAATLQSLSDLGVRIAVDDFGTGYSSLGRLRHFPVDFLKIDRTFISEIGNDAADTALVRSMIELGHGLGMSVIAEGVENDEQATLLRELGCDVTQGYLYTQPLREFDIVTFLQATNDAG